ncbi:serine/threonine-protein kinase rio2 [Thalictrum thalictroides]|uniref:Serine/threonine-protein kinase rio2 n=1 Tax=Thalictrum thalictroides TaxID=46969 RepID=A0A7J6VM73_THATH|nr:serine/threonine-protein kinase rio2 [Thalictrum thalictroides]
MSISANNFVQENADSDSEGNSDNDDGPADYYQPISAVDDNQEDEDDNDKKSDGGDFNSSSTNSENPNCRDVLSNGHGRRIDLNEEEDESADEEEVRIRAEAAERAFREDENRRNAPLPAENATRIMDAMRGISLGSGFTPPDWANRVPEDQWIDQLRRLRVQTPSTFDSCSQSINN